MPPPETTSSLVVPSPASRAALLVRGAERIVIVTGAGMSAESGVPTFRDALTGLWARFDPDELATVEAFRSNPARVFGWYLARFHGARRVEPHAGYHALVEMERLVGDLPIITQNVDGLHRRSGSKDVIELHGSLSRFRCLDVGHAYPADRILDLGDPRDEGPVHPPACLECGGPVRPCVVWFGEMLPIAALQRAWDLIAGADVVIVIGTSAMVYPAAELPMMARAGGATVIEINPGPTPFTPQANLYWGARAGEALPQLVESLRVERMST